MTKKDNLIWLDLEMTGLDFDNDVILEIATIVTDIDLNILAYGPNIAINQPESVINKMDAWCTKTHTKSGLVDRIRKSPITTRDAERQTLTFLKSWATKNTAPLCGNSIWVDRRFLAKDMPDLEEFFHYRNIDVSTIKELAHKWRPDIKRMVKKNNHKAIEDIKNSIAELKHYTENFINKK